MKYLTVKHLPIIALGTAAALTLAACNPTPQQQHALQCGAATLGGAAVGATAGNQFGGGTGRTVMTAIGGAAGATSGQALGC